MGEPAPALVTRDAFFGGRLVLDQPAKGHRSGTDAVLLAAAVPRDFSGLAYDVGSGVGAVGLGVAVACPGARVLLVEREPVCVALADANIATNGLADRAGVVACDVLGPGERREKLPRKADLVVTNPPFYAAARVRASPEASRRAAHVFEAGQGLADWLAACLDLLTPKGTLIVVHQAEAVPEMLVVLGPRLGGTTLLPVLPRPGAPAVRALLRGTVGSRAPFRIAAPLVLHTDCGFTPEAAALHEGVATLGW